MNECDAVLQMLIPRILELRGHVSQEQDRSRKGKMAEWLRVLVALVEFSGSFPNSLTVGG